MKHKNDDLPELGVDGKLPSGTDSEWASSPPTLRWLSGTENRSLSPRVRRLAVEIREIECIECSSFTEIYGL